MLYKKTEYLLYNYKKIQAEIKNINIEIEELENTYEGTTGINISGEPSSKTNKFNSIVENEIVNKQQRINYLNQLKMKKENQIKKVDNALEILTEDDRKLIELRYFERIPNYQVAIIFNMTEEGCSMRKRRIVENIKNILILD